MTYQTNNTLDKTDLRSLVGHPNAVPATYSIAQTYEVFRACNTAYLAVIRADRTVVGLCSRHNVGMLLAHPFGNALYAKALIAEHIHPEPLIVRDCSAISDVLQSTFNRKEHYYYDDVILTDEEYRFIGLIHAQTLVRLQTKFLTENNAQLRRTTEALNQRNQQMEEDLVMAGKLQTALLPQTMPHLPCSACKTNVEVSFSHRFIPCGQVGGDFFYLFKTSDHSFGALICDVMGHGVRSALITGIIRATMEQLQHLALQPAKVLKVLNERVCTLFMTSREFIFVTASYIHIDLKEQTVSCANAGHHNPLCYYNNREATELFKDNQQHTGPALGFFANAVYHETQTTIDADLHLFLYTDGLFEALDQEGNEFGMSRILEFINRRNTAQSTDELLDELLADVHDFSHTDRCEDDICLLDIHIKNLPKIIPEQHPSEQCTHQPEAALCS